MIKHKESFLFFLISIFAFLINFYVGSNGVYPVDTFIHYDNGYRILLGEHPIKDYWIVHGFLIDYIQAIFSRKILNFGTTSAIHSISLHNNIDTHIFILHITNAHRFLFGAWQGPPTRT